MEKEDQKKQVPNLKLDEQQRVSVQTIEVPLLINGTEVKVTIRKLSTGVRNKIQGDCTQTKVIAGQPSIMVNSMEIQEKILVACIVRAPFETNLNGIKELPAEVSDYLFDEYNAFAEPSLKKKDSSKKD